MLSDACGSGQCKRTTYVRVAANHRLNISEGFMGSVTHVNQPEIGIYDENTER